MAFASIGTIGTGNSTATDTTLSLTTSAAAEAGNLVILCIGLDNHQTTDGQTSEISSVSDPNSNTWTKLGEFCNGQGAANDGATVSVWSSVITTTIASSSVITITLANSKARKCVSGWEFSLGASSVSVAGTLQTLANDAADPGSMSISGLSSKEYLFLRATASETADTTAVTTTASYTLITKASASGAGTAADQMSVFGEFRILTGTGDTSDPAYVSADHASVYMAIQEPSAAVRSPSGGVAYGGRVY